MYKDKATDDKYYLPRWRFSLRTKPGLVVHAHVFTFATSKGKAFLW